MAAVLEDALQCVSRPVFARSGTRWREFVDAYDWIWDEGRDWPFSFTNVCDLLGLDATAVRQRLQHVVNTPRGKSEDASKPFPPAEPNGWERAPSSEPPMRQPPGDERDRFDVVQWDEV